MKVYVTGKVEGETKKSLKEKIEKSGHEFKSLTKATELLSLQRNLEQRESLVLVNGALRR